MPASASSVHVWVPGMKETGGIQHYSSCLIQALAELFPDSAIEVLSKNDATAVSSFENVRVRSFGTVPRRFRTMAFAASGMALSAVQRPGLIIATHPHFAKALHLASGITGIPWLTSAHGIETWGALQGWFRQSLAGATGLLPVSDFTAQALINEGHCDPARIRVVADTFREEAFSPGPKPLPLLARHGLHPDQPVLLTVGRLEASEAYKGQDKVIAALKIIRQTIPETRYLIVGKGNDISRLQRCVDEHGQQEAVIFTGFVSEQELPDYYRLCDAFVMPSTGEGFGIVYLETLASGRPCVVGNLDASPEAIGHGRLGFAVDPHSVPALAEAVLKLLTKQHDKPWLHEPETLRREVVELYGFQSFKRSLRAALEHLVPSFAATAAG